MNNKEDEGTVLITLNTINRLSSSTISNPFWYLESSVQDIKSFKLKSMMVPLSTYDIDSRNNKVYFTETTSGTLKTATLTSENYTADQLASELTTQLLDAGDYTYNVTHNNQKNVFTIQCTGGSASTSANFYITTGSASANYELGINSADMTALNMGTSGSLTLTDQVDISGVKNIFIATSAFSTKYSQSGYNILASIHTTTLSGSIATYTDTSNDYITINENHLNQMNFILLDERLRKINMNKDYVATIAFKTF